MSKVAKMLREQLHYQGLFVLIISDDDHDTQMEHDVMAEEMMNYYYYTISMMIISTLISNKLSFVCFLRKLKLN